MLLFLPHTGPDIRVNDVGHLNRLGRILLLDQLPVGHVLLEELQEVRIQTVPRRGRENEADAELATAQRQRSGHVVAITDEDKGASLEVAENLVNGIQVRESLAGMAIVGEPVDDRTRRDGRERLDRLV